MALYSGTRVPQQELKGLYFEKENFSWIEHEVQKLMGLIGAEYEQLAATGGEPIDNVFGKFPHLAWDDLVKTFLGTEKI